MTRRLLEGHSKQVLFYVHDSKSRVRLALVGTDIRGTGHFVYKSEPDFADFVAAPPLRGTNRSQVMSWLAQLGANQQAPMRKDSIEKELKKPDVDRKYEAIREDTGKTEEGYHYKNFYLVGNDGEEMLAIKGPKRNRRYMYSSVSELNSQSFDSSKECMEWLEWVIGKREKPPLSKRDRKAFKSYAATGLLPDQKKTTTESSSIDEPPTVEMALAGRSDLLEWVTKDPDKETLKVFHEWAEKLGGNVVDEQPAEDVTGPNSKWTSSEDAIEILERIDRLTKYCFCLWNVSTSREVLLALPPLPILTFFELMWMCSLWDNI
ncbi:hypothetical protein BSKO_05816 [Bryopsis sp. KO-2023]|nr:hypothetical protein BSKO_05816 [Bryopsis sp. KO-2023]